MRAKIINLIINSSRLLYLFEFATNLNASKFAFLYHFLKHFTVKKFINMLKVELSYLQAKPHNLGYPYILVVDPTNVCNLNCPLCPTGLNKSGRRKGMMSFETFKSALGVLSEYALGVIIYNWGEPLLNPQIYKMIEYASKQNLATYVSTNLTLLNETSAERLIKSGLEHLRVSIDGTCQESYGRFRRGGDYNRVIENLKLLMGMREKQKSNLPLIDWYFLVTQHNEREIHEAMNIAKRLKVDHIYFVRLIPTDIFHHASLRFLKDEFDPLAIEWLPDNKAFRYSQDKPYLYDVRCPWLWRYVVINHDGSISPCCFIDNEETDLGNILEDNFDEIWNNESFKTSRMILGNPDSDALDKRIVCYRCNYFKK